MSNLLVQAEVYGNIPVGTIRDVIRASERQETFEPRRSAEDRQAERFSRLRRPGVPC